MCFDKTKCYRELEFCSDTGVWNSTLCCGLACDLGQVIEPQFYHMNNERGWCYHCPYVLISVSILSCSQAFSGE